jgi:hypothetical protein
MDWENNIIEALERHIEEDPPSDTMYDKQFYQSLQKYRPAYHFLADLIVAHIKPTSVIDFGCGCGFILEKLMMHGITDVHGIEGSREVQPFIPESLINNIEIADVLLADSAGYDLAITIEVAEHIAKKDSAKFVNNICNASDNLIWWTAAAPGQAGTGHVNCKDLCWWISIFKEVGLFEPNYERTYEIKQAMLQNHQLSLGFSWLRDNFILLEEI